MRGSLVILMFMHAKTNGARVAWKVKGHPPKLGFPAKGCTLLMLPTRVRSRYQPHNTNPRWQYWFDQSWLLDLTNWIGFWGRSSFYLQWERNIDSCYQIVGGAIFMGYLPYETRFVDKKHPAQKAHLHHSLLVKPEAEYLTTHILSNLPSKEEMIGDSSLLSPSMDWEMILNY